MFAPVVHGVVASVEPIQLGSLRVVFGRLGQHYVPQLALETVRELRQDAVYGFLVFLARVGINPDQLLGYGAVLERDRFERSVGLLLEVDAIRRDFDVSPQPIYDAIRRSLFEAENLLDKMHQVKAALKRISQSGVLFSEYRRWVVSVRQRLEEWEKYTSGEIEEVLTACQSYETLQTQFELVLDEIAETTARLRHSDHWQALQDQVTVRIDEVGEIRRGVIEEPTGGDEWRELEIEHGIRLLTGILRELNDLLGGTNGASRDRHSKAEAAIQHACAVLGVSETDTRDTIRKAYWRAAMEHHPDQNKGDLEAEARFREVHEAYEELRRSRVWQENGVRR